MALPIPFNNPATYPGHSGVDFPQARGTIVRASGPGVIGLRNSNSRGGNMVWVDYDGYPGVAYAHLDDYRDSPPVGTRVNEGDVICRVGNSGFSTGPHLHMEVYGHATTDGFWRFFDRNRVVGGGSGAGTPSSPDQRVTIAVTNGRAEPTTQSGIVGEALQAGVVGNFVGWIRGESVEGNNVWFKGTSGRWFWSGGFQGGANTAGLPDLNPVVIAPHQRKVGPNGSNGRIDPNSSGSVVATLAPGSIHDFTGWIRGESVEGNDIWFRGSAPLFWYWSGGFEGGANTAGLPDLNATTPAPATNQRTVGPSGANGRANPNTSGGVTQTLAPGTVADFNGWTRGESVEGNNIWFRGAHSGDWFWSGGFTSQAIEGLIEVTSPMPNPEPEPEPEPTSDNPRGLPEYAPVYPRAHKGLKAPLGFLGDGQPALRNTAGSTPVTPIIDRFIIHHTATTADQLDWFSYENSRSVCPTFYLRTDGKVFEMIRPGSKPAATGATWNWRSIAVETLNSTGSPTWEVTDAQLEELAQMIAWLAEFDGKTLDGVPVSFKIDREHVITHGEVLATACPGPYLQPRVDAIVARAKAIYDEKHPVPDPEPDDKEQIKALIVQKLEEVVSLVREL